jgi:aminoglycoside phosphotransferase
MTWDEMEKSLKEEYKRDSLGKSKSCVFLSKNRVVKINQKNVESINEIAVLKKYNNTNYFPKIEQVLEKENQQMIVMSRVPGIMACDESWYDQPKRLVEKLAEGLKELWSLPIKNEDTCVNLQTKIKLAEENVRSNYPEIDTSDTSLMKKQVFSSSQNLLSWLKGNAFENQIVFTHGDACLPNIFITPEDKVKWIDLGKAGPGEKWQDIAILYRSLKDNFTGRYSTKKKVTLSPDYLFEALGILPNWDKINYYLLLDELL